MTYAAELQTVLYASESSFCEVSSTFGTALSLVAEVDLSNLARDIADTPILKQRVFDDVAGVLMPFEGKSITVRGRLTGLGATAAGAVPSSDLAALLGLVVGNVGNALATGTTFDGTGTAVAPGTTAADGVAAGALVRMGALLDGRGGGQFHLAASHATSVLTLLMAAAAAPNNGDVLYAGKMVYPDALVPSELETMTSLRLRVLTSNGQYDLRGCYPMALRFTGLGIGEIPEWELELGVAHVDTASTTFPSATVPQRHAGAPVVNGSFAIQAVGTTTRATLDIRAIEVDLGFSGVGIKGLGGNYEGQVITACRRVPGVPTVSVVVDKEHTGTDTWWDLAEVDPNAIVWRNAVFSACCGDGRGVGMAWPSLRLMGKQPIQMNHEGRNRQRLTFRARTGATTSSDLEASPWRLALS
jgi:hypothetical protein